MAGGGRAEGDTCERGSAPGYRPAMEITDFIAVVDDEGRRFATAASAAGLDTAVPACPGWSVADLTRHLGAVHRWAGRIVAERLASGADATIEGELAAAPDDGDLIDWFAAGHERLVDALRHGLPTDDFWRFSRNAPNSLTFWARRQAHETAIHRVDAEQAAGPASEPFTAAFATDGIDELAAVFLSRKRRGSDPPLTILVRAADAERAWHVTLRADGMTATTDPEPVPDRADVTIGGPSDVLYRLLWNRLGLDDPRVQVVADPARVDSWRPAIAVT